MRLHPMYAHMSTLAPDLQAAANAATAITGNPQAGAALNALTGGGSGGGLGVNGGAGGVTAGGGTPAVIPAALNALTGGGSGGGLGVPGGTGGITARGGTPAVIPAAGNALTGGVGTAGMGGGGGGAGGTDPFAMVAQGALNSVVQSVAERDPVVRQVVQTVQDPGFQQV